jgi:hypothetical protein
MRKQMLAMQSGFEKLGRKSSTQIENALTNFLRRPLVAWRDFHLNSIRLQRYVPGSQHLG